MKSSNKIKHRAIIAAMFSVLSATAAAQDSGFTSIDELFSLVDTHSKSVIRAVASQSTAEAAMDAAKNAKLPDINISVSGSYSGNPVMMDRDFSNSTTLHGPHWGNSAALTVRQIVYGGGAINSSIELANLGKEMAGYDLENERQRVKFMIAGYYLDLYKFYNLLSVCEKNISRTNQVISDMKAKEQQGTALPNDVTRYEVQLQNLLYRKTEINSQIEVLNNQIVTMLALDNGTQIKPDTTLSAQVLEHYEASQLQEQALQNRPALKAGETAVELSRTEQKLVKSDKLPKVIVLAEDHFNGPITFELPPIDKNLNTWFVGVGVSYNIGSLYKTNKDITRSSRKISEAESRLDENKERVSLEVYQALVHYNNSFELVRTQEKSLQLAEENYNVVENRYKNDLAVIIDLLDADNLRQDAEIQLINAKINSILQYYRLKFVTGTI